MTMDREKAQSLDAQQDGFAIPVKLGHAVNVALQVTELYRICPTPDLTFFYDLCSRENGIRSDESYDPMLTDWGTTEMTDEPIEGFLKGFPTLHAPEGDVTVMHLHALMDDIEVSSWGIPLHKIQELYRYSPEHAKLLGHAHDIGGDESLRYEVPLLFDRKLGHHIRRPAKAGDIMMVINELDHPPVQVYSNPTYPAPSSRPSRYVL